MDRPAKGFALRPARILGTFSASGSAVLNATTFGTFGREQVAADLFHPRGIRVGRDASDVHAACVQVHGRENVKRRQSSARPDLDGREFGGKSSITVGLQKSRPYRCSRSIRCWFNAMSLQHVGDGGIADVVADVLQRCLNAIVAPMRDSVW